MAFPVPWSSLEPGLGEALGDLSFKVPSNPNQSGILNNLWKVRNQLQAGLPPFEGNLGWRERMEWVVTAEFQQLGLWY